ncbi:MAG: pantoate--beta-alanine ligase [Alphaproteobacteria bacterium]|jgi:pantoate--beta-alanine ligase|nr:pantoate--beta-alanine ligase [Alphaproteobacteria bacterium]MDP7222075.1 pantoate--beta-alanine ligase [Alphaproteobacteria bacterium]
MQIINDIPALRAYRQSLTQAGKTLALIPTMGALHEGHLSLVKAGLEKADNAIVSIFVNPTQFGPNEDFDAYPRNVEADCEKLASVGASAVYVPAVDTMYPDPFFTTIHVDQITEPLEGACRPGHFDGVATIVAKLLLQTLPDIALFGEKDYQQLQLIKTMARDLDIPVDITGVPTVRDKNGLALSSRNAYLDDREYDIATTLNKTLFTLRDRLKAGEDITTIKQDAIDTLTANGFRSVDYVDIRHADTLAAIDQFDPAVPMRILAAAYLGKARLIDNIAV